MKTAKNVLKEVFGYSEFRNQQEQIVENLIAGEDALVLMPTGGGKSLCYQIPSIIRPGTGVVISPLIALMEDQVNALRMLGVKAAYIIPHYLLRKPKAYSQMLNREKWICCICHLSD